MSKETSETLTSSAKIIEVLEVKTKTTSKAKIILLKFIKSPD
jgi:hypothetical protein